jgi:hypothetical protein
MDTPKDYVSIHYEVDIGFQHLLLSKDELKKIVESEEECKKIRVVSKAYTFPLFSDLNTSLDSGLPISFFYVKILKP